MKVTGSRNSIHPIETKSNGLDNQAFQNDEENNWKNETHTMTLTDSTRINKV